MIARELVELACSSSGSSGVDQARLKNSTSCAGSQRVHTAHITSKISVGSTSSARETQETCHCRGCRDHRRFGRSRSRRRRTGDRGHVSEPRRGHCARLRTSDCSGSSHARGHEQRQDPRRPTFPAATQTRKYWRRRRRSSRTAGLRQILTESPFNPPTRSATQPKTGCAAVRSRPATPSTGSQRGLHS